MGVTKITFKHFWAIELFDVNVQLYLRDETLATVNTHMFAVFKHAFDSWCLLRRLFQSKS